MDPRWQAIFRASTFLLLLVISNPDTLLQDLWTHTDNGTAVRNFTAHQVPPHGVVALLLKDAGNEPDGLWPPCARFEWCTDQNGTRLDDIGFGDLPQRSFSL